MTPIRPAITLICLLLTALYATAATYSAKTVPNVQLADSARYVSNPDSILSPLAEANINRALASLRGATTAEASFVIVDDIDSDSPDDFATELFRLWGLGDKKKDNGLLVLVVKDRRKIVIRTGYGLEGVLPDIKAGRLIRHDFAPHASAGDFDAASEAIVSHITDILSESEAAGEIRAYDEATDGDLEWAELLKAMLIYLAISALTAVLLCLYIVYRFHGPLKRLDEIDRYRRLEAMRPVVLAVTVFGFGLPVAAYLLLRHYMKATRNHPRRCPNCGETMRKLDEQADNAYLTPSQDAEEHLNSVDYDVWLCSNCGETDIIPYINRNVPYTPCPYCMSRACRHVGDRIIVPPTSRQEGRGAKTFKCMHCGKRHEVPYAIAKSAPTVIVPMGGGGHGGGFGGGGFSGGSFGGGSTGGGGASGSW